MVYKILSSIACVGNGKGLLLHDGGTTLHLTGDQDRWNIYRRTYTSPVNYGTTGNTSTTNLKNNTVIGVAKSNSGIVTASHTYTLTTKQLGKFLIKYQ